jgi:hypothetical protein
VILIDQYATHDGALRAADSALMDEILASFRFNP